MQFSRREFSKRVLGSVSILGILPQETQALSLDSSPFGPLRKDRNRNLDLPSDFSYRIISRQGKKMADGFYVPGSFDGMGTFPGLDGLVILLRNHEFRAENHPSSGPFKGKKKIIEKLDPALVYDPGTGKGPCCGGTTTLVYDPEKKKVVREFLSLIGTMTNCSGNPTPWGTWLSCEESREDSGSDFAKNHGYVFEVPVSPEPQLAPPVPIPEMGRFVHEGAAVDPPTGIVYLTEDQPDSLFYRFLPKTAGRLHEGGELQCLTVASSPWFDTRNWRSRTRIELGRPLPVGWIPLEDVDRPEDDLRKRGYRAGGSLFARGEGICKLGESLYFSCTTGGPKGLGQIWRYQPSPAEGTPSERSHPGNLELMAEITDPRVLQNPDQLNVAPWGDILICEDGEGVQHVKGMTSGGQFYPLARNARDASELTGVCFSPDGSTLFLNNMAAGLTFAIQGPWKSGS